jgi:hypothetical protein
VIVAYRPGAEGSYPTGGIATVELTDEQRAWIIYCVKRTPAPHHDLEAQSLAVSCVVALGGQF